MGQRRYFNPRSPHGERQGVHDFVDFPLEISIHAPRTGSDRPRDILELFFTHFNPRSPHGERLVDALNARGWTQFQSTLPARGATRYAIEDILRLQISIHAPRTGSDINFSRGVAPATFISIHAPRTGSDDGDWYDAWDSGAISIHAPRTGSDDNFHTCANRVLISIHAPRTGSDLQGLRTAFARRTFQSTLPARGATVPDGWMAYSTGFQSTLPARGATIFHGIFWQNLQISIHAPRTGSDAIYTSFKMYIFGISIHAPRTGSDKMTLLVFWKQLYFNPRSPHGERLFVAGLMIGLSRFQSTLPARGATSGGQARRPRAGDFNPRSPHGERHFRRNGNRRERLISIHAPRTGSDSKDERSALGIAISIHAPRTGSDINRFSHRPCIDAFQSTLPARGATGQGTRPIYSTTEFQSTLPARGATGAGVL